MTFFFDLLSFDFRHVKKYKTISTGQTIIPLKDEKEAISPNRRDNMQYLYCEFLKFMYKKYKLITIAKFAI